MFCGKCGFQLKDFDVCCPRCGWSPKNAVLPDTPTKTAEENKTVFVGEQKAPRQDWQTQAPQNFDFDDTARQDFPSEKYYPPVPNFYTPPQVNSDDKLIPEAYRNPSAAPEPKKSRKGLIAAIIIVSVALLAVGGLIAYQFIYINSDGYKLGQAEKSILAGDYQTGLETISELQTKQAQDTRAFVQFLTQKESFAADYNSGMLQGSQDSVSEKTAALWSSFEALGDDLQLPEKLSESYQLYRKRYSAMREGVDKISPADLTDAQYCVLEFKKRKEGENFTVNKLQSIVSTSEPAVKAIEDKWYNTDSFREFANASSAQAVKTANEFYQTVSTQLSQDKFDLETYQKSYSGDTAIKLSDTEKNHDAFVGTGLKSLKENADAEQNAKALFEALKIAWTAFAFEVQ